MTYTTLPLQADTAEPEHLATWHLEMMEVDAEIEKDMEAMKRTHTGWYAPPDIDFDQWLETPEGQLWLEDQLASLERGSLSFSKTEEPEYLMQVYG